MRWRIDPNDGRTPVKPWSVERVPSTPEKRAHVLLVLRGNGANDGAVLEAEFDDHEVRILARDLLSATP